MTTNLSNRFLDNSDVARFGPAEFRIIRSRINPTGYPKMHVDVQSELILA